jgi:CBS domain-containing protein
MELVDTVSQLLSAKGNEVWSVEPSISVFEAVEVLSTRNIGALPVMTGETLLGIISERDYARKVVLKGKSSRGTTVQEIMIRDVITVSPQHKIEDCMKIMTKSRIRHLPVVEEGEVIGVVSSGDLVNWIISAQQETIDHLEKFITGKYPA